MAETLLKPLKNEFTIIGRVKEIDLEDGENSKGVECIKGSVIILVEEKVDGELRSHEHKVRVYSNKYKNDGTLNGRYKGFKTVLDTYKAIDSVNTKQEADLVRVTGSYGVNEYIGEDGTLKTYKQLEAVFFTRLEKEEVLKLKGPKAELIIEVVIDEIKELLDEEMLPKDEKLVKAYNVDFYKEPNPKYNPVIPIEAIIKEPLADKFSDMYVSGDTGKLKIKLNNYLGEAEEEEIEEVEMSGFGDLEDMEDKPRGKFVNNYEIIGGSLAYEEPKAYEEEAVVELKEWRQRKLDELEDGYVPKDDFSDGFGDVSNEKEKEKPKTEVKSEEINDDDLPDF